MDVLPIIEELNKDENYILTGSHAVEFLRKIYCSSCKSVLRDDSDLDFIYLGTFGDLQRPFSIQKCGWEKISEPLTLKPVTYLYEGIKIDILVSIEKLRNNILNIKIDQIDEPIKIVNPNYLKLQYEEELEEELEGYEIKKYPEKIHILNEVIKNMN